MAGGWDRTAALPFILANEPGHDVLVQRAARFSVPWC